MKLCCRLSVNCNQNLRIPQSHTVTAQEVEVHIVMALIVTGPTVTAHTVNHGVMAHEVVTLGANQNLRRISLTYGPPVNQQEVNQEVTGHGVETLEANPIQKRVCLTYCFQDEEVAEGGHLITKAIMTPHMATMADLLHILMISSLIIIGTHILHTSPDPNCLHLAPSHILQLQCQHLRRQRCQQQ